MVVCRFPLVRSLRQLSSRIRMRVFFFYIFLLFVYVGRLLRHLRLTRVM